MKKFMISSLFIIALSVVANAQEFRIGGKAGANLNKVTGKEFKEEFDLGYHLGAFVEVDFSKKWGIQPEVIWNQINTKRANNFDAVYNNWQDSTGTIKLGYLSIPILLRYNVTNLLTFHLGPQFGILLNQDKTLLKNGEEAFKSGEFSMVGGLQVNLKTFRVYGRYNVGLSNIKDLPDQGKWKNQQLQLGVGVRL
ncbi:MAG TPA: porin family protein [Segetibacter sp.]